MAKDRTSGSGTGKAKCPICEAEIRRGEVWTHIDMRIWHDNGHVWPGFAGEPDGGNYGGSDF